MAELVRIEPSRFCAGEAWFIFDDGRQFLRKVDRESAPAASAFPTPSIRKDSIDPCRGMDGKMYDSLSGLRRTYRPDGNPQGERYHEIGNTELTPQTYDFNRKERRDDIRAAIEDVRNGRVPPAPEA